MKELYSCLATEFARIADRFVQHGHLSLQPGTYTSSDIQKIIRARLKDIERNKRNFVCPMGNDAILEDELCTYEEVSHKYGLCRVQLIDLFTTIKDCEKRAGIRGKNIHTWTVNDNREVYASATLSFHNEKIMKSLSSAIKLDHKTNKASVVLSLRDGCLRNIPLARSKNFSHLSLRPDDYVPIEAYSHLSFIINNEQLKHIYGKCKLYLYGNSEGSYDSIINPYHFRIVIVNESGWVISSDDIMPMSPEFINMYDGSFTYHGDDRNYEEELKQEDINESECQSLDLSGLCDYSNNDQATEQVDDCGDSSSTSIPCSENFYSAPSALSSAIPDEIKSHQHDTCNSLKLSLPAPTEQERDQEGQPASSHYMKQGAIRRSPKKQRFLKPKRSWKKYVEHSVKKLHFSRSIK